MKVNEQSSYCYINSNFSMSFLNMTGSLHKPNDNTCLNLFLKQQANSKNLCPPPVFLFI